ncbi:MAG TPA: ATP-binding cassette domain-containing protein [Gemmatimonadaceae bacterium]|jgi:ABC-type multidrug transport system ATPase subunit|nr:ATP-binding cassette domain-containing protein [Gemmatimonadaceae bacterium]
MSDLLSMRGVCKNYHSGVRGCSASVVVLRDVDLDARAGEVTAIVAGPASGKTTLLMCASGLMRPDRGTISWFGGAPNRDLASRPHGIAYAGDRPFPYAFLTARETLEYAAIVRDLPLRDNGRRVSSVLERAGLGAVADRRVDALDGGAQTRLALAAALLAEPRLLVVDDVPPGCDPASATEAAALLRGVAAEGGAVIVAGRFVTSLSAGHVFHPTVPTRTYVLSAGRLEALLDPPNLVPRLVGVGRARVAEVEQSSAGEFEGR